jgi:SsrA-binding protein
VVPERRRTLPLRRTLGQRNDQLAGAKRPTHSKEAIFCAEMAELVVFVGRVGRTTGDFASMHNGGVMARPIQLIPNAPKKAKVEAGVTGGEKKIVASNRKARHDYDILETYEAGICLQGSEVKALRDAKVQFKDSYARVERGEMLLVGINISQYEFAHGVGAHVSERTRKLLLHKSEIRELEERMTKDHLSVLPLSIYFLNGRAKVELAVARGRKLHDKRQVMAERDSKMEMARVMSETRRLRAAKNSKSSFLD